MPDRGTVLKELLRQRHLQTHSSFSREYDRAARTVDQSLIGRGPSKAQFYRWLSGEVSGLPYAPHCIVLEKMFPGRTVRELFAPARPAVSSVPPPTAAPTSPNRLADTLDLSRAFRARSEFTQHLPPHAIFDGARRIRCAGLSLNLICQQYADSHLRAVVMAGGIVECLFLDPECEETRAREHEEGHASGHLRALTRLNIELLQRFGGQLPPTLQDNVVARTYPGPLRFNLTFVDDRMCVAQPYLPFVRGLESPTLVIDRQPDGAGLFGVFERVFDSLWQTGRPL